MKLRSFAAGALALALSHGCAQAQTNPGTSPLSGAKGGTNNSFMQFTGPATSMKTFTLPNASDTIATLTGSQTLTNKTFNCANNTCTVRIANDVTGLGTGCATFLGTPSSANLRGCLTDEVGTGAFYTVGGALGTPASGTATNLTGLPPSGLTAQAAWSFLVNNTSGSASPTAVDIASLTTKASPAAGDYVILSDQAASGALKKATASSLASAGSVSSIAGNTGAFTLGYGITNSGNEIRMRTGAVIGSKSATPYTNNTALSALIPLDDTVPTSSEGTEILTMSYTPIISTSTMRCRFNGTVSNGAADNVVASIFQGSTNFGAQMINVTGANTKHTFHIEAEYAPGSTSAQTISVRAGGGATAIYFNGGSAGRLLGGAQGATLTCEEIAP